LSPTFPFFLHLHLILIKLLTYTWRCFMLNIKHFVCGRGPFWCICTVFI
jgi:hypothetical protein